MYKCLKKIINSAMKRKEENYKESNCMLSRNSPLLSSDLYRALSGSATASERLGP